MAIVSVVRGQVAINGQVLGMAGARKSFYPALTTVVETVASTSVTLCGWYIYNPNSDVAYVQCFGTEQFGGGDVTLGTTEPAISLGIPPGSAANLMAQTGVQFTGGLKVAATTTAQGSTAPALGLTVNLYYT